MAIDKPPDIAAHPVKSRVWDEVTTGRNFTSAQIPNLRLLCNWHAIAERCMEDLDFDGRTQVAYENKLEDIKVLPQIPTLKQASAEIRALNKLLGIEDEPVAQPKETKLHVIQGRRADRKARAEGAG